MSEKRGCLKMGLMGCGALMALVVVFVMVMGGLALIGKGRGGRVDGEATPVFEASGDTGGGAIAGTFDPGDLTTRHGGRVVLDLGQGEFQLRPAAPGEGLRVQASFDSEVHAVSQTYMVAPDSSWVCRITFEQTMPALQALFRQMLGGETNASIDIWLPRDVPIELVARIHQGGGEAELGGLWLTTADISFKQGGFALEIDEPLREPMERFRLYGRMGGVTAEGLGNASPRILDVDCGMGGAEINLTGAWRNDCDARLSVRMGGIAAFVPDDMVVETEHEVQGAMRRTDSEMPQPVLRLVVEESMGEVEVIR